MLADSKGYLFQFSTYCGKEFSRIESLADTVVIQFLAKLKRAPYTVIGDFVEVQKH